MDRPLGDGELFWRAFHACPLPMGITRLADGRFLDVNRAFESLVGFSRDELVGRTSAEVGLWIEPADRDGVMRELRERGTLEHSEHRMKTKSGDLVVIDYSLALLDTDGGPCLFGIATDITESERERGLLELVVSNAPIVVFALDGNGMITLSEGQVLTGLGLTPGQHVGKSLFELYPDPFFDSLWSRVTAGEEVRANVPVGDRFLDVFCSPTRDLESGAISGAIGVATDVTEQHRAQDARARLWGQLVRTQESERARIADELHDGPIQQLAALQLRLAALHDLLPDSPLPSKLETAVEEGLAGLRRMVTELRPSALDRLGLAATVEADLYSLNSSLGMEVDLDSVDLLHEPDADVSITAYRAIQQVLSNVRQHSQASSVHLRLSSHEGGLLVRVRDDGVGFDPVPGEPGHIGLPSMREQIELAGGWTRVLSTPGSGTTIEFWMPSPTEPDSA